MVEKDPYFIDTPGPRSQTPLYFAASHGKLAIVEYLLNKFTVTSKYSEATNKVSLGSLQIGEFIDIDATDDFGNTALITSCVHGYISIANKLLENRAYVGAKTKNGDHVTQICAEKGYLNMLKLIAKYDSSYMDTKGEFGRTPLNTASFIGHYDVVEYILNTCDVDIGTLDDNQHTPYFNASQNGHKSIMQLLLQKKAP